MKKNPLATSTRRSFGIYVVSMLFCFNATAASTSYFVKTSGNNSNNGSEKSPFLTIDRGLDAANPGDSVIVGKGTYAEVVSTKKAGTANAKIILRAVKGEEVKVGTKGKVLNIEHDYNEVDGIIFDGLWGDKGMVAIKGNYASLKNCTVKNNKRDGINVLGVTGVVIDNCKIYNLLRYDGKERVDAHGITGRNPKNLLIKRCDISQFSGDGVQFDPSRSTPGWNNIIIEDCTFWLAPVSKALSTESGFPEGEAPGENAVDTKTPGIKGAFSETRCNLSIKNCVVYGFKNGLIDNMAAYNIKENVDCVIEGGRMYANQIACRLRYPANVTVKNCTASGNEVAIRVEGGAKVVIDSVTFDKDNEKPIVEKGGEKGNGSVEIRNCNLPAKQKGKKGR